MMTTNSFKIVLAALFAVSACTPAVAGSQSGYSEQNTCFREEYREEYVPGTADNPGYIKSWKGLQKILQELAYMMSMKLITMIVQMVQ